MGVDIHHPSRGDHLIHHAALKSINVELVSDWDRDCTVFDTSRRHEHKLNLDIAANAYLLHDIFPEGASHVSS